MLWEGSLVMVDSETGSLWSHLLGEAMRGKLQGQTLDVIPSVLTDWRTWRERHEKTTIVIMPRTSDFYFRDYHRPDSGLVIGVAGKDSARAWPLSTLHREPVINDHFDGVPVVVLFDRDSFSAVIYDRRVDGRELKFEEDMGNVVDLETGSQWDWLTGSATTPPMQGKQLKALPGIVSDGAAWSLYHPESKLYIPSEYSYSSE